MSKAPTCVACNTTMKEGFIPDIASSEGSARQLSWHPGKVEASKMLGIKTGGVKYDKKAVRKITAYRCNSCGLVLPFAH